KIVSQLKRSQQSVGKYTTDHSLRVQTTGSYKLVPEELGIMFQNDTNIYYIYSDQPIEAIEYKQRINTDEVIIPIPITLVDLEGFPIHRIMGNKLILDSTREIKNG